MGDADGHPDRRRVPHPDVSGVGESWMRSEDLRADGFVHWHAFNSAGKRALLDILPCSYGVYAIRRKQDYEAKRGASDITYVGTSSPILPLAKRRMRNTTPADGGPSIVPDRNP